MPDSNPTDIATRESWKTLPVPEARAELEFLRTYDLADFDRIKHGLIPQAMEDKWFIFFEEPWLYLQTRIPREGISCCAAEAFRMVLAERLVADAMT